MFRLLGLPGLALAAVVRFTLKEPRREISPNNAATRLTPAVPASVRPTLKEVCLTLWNQKTFRHLLLCFVVTIFFAYGIGQWQPAFFMRSFGLHTGELGTWLAVIYGVGGLIGTYIGGALASRYAANNERLQLKVVALLYCGLSISWIGTYLSTTHYLAFGFLAVGVVTTFMANAPLLATIQTLVRPHMRAMSIALLFLFANLIGMGLGPLAAGVLSDVLRPWAGDESLRYALLVLCPGLLWSAWHVWQASTTVASDLGTVDAHQDEKFDIKEPGSDSAVEAVSLWSR